MPVSTKSFLIKQCLRFWLIAVGCLHGISSQAQTLPLIPCPDTVLWHGKFISEPIIIAADLIDRLNLFQRQQLAAITKEFAANEIDDRKAKRVGLYVVALTGSDKPESYRLKITEDSILISANDANGYTFALASLKQLLQSSTVISDRRSAAVPIVDIYDSPRFLYRGMHLDVSRHFFTVEEVKKYLDYLAYYKFNRFHWHLTDDQGWRIEIKQYPLLTSVGAWRDGTIVGHYPGTGNDNKRYGGFYTQVQIRDVVRYAADRGITVVPEIEMPGHASAAIAAYPLLSCFPGQDTELPPHPSRVANAKRGKKVIESWGVYDDIFCAGNDSVFPFLQNVLTEILPLFPSEYIHIGGDEAPKKHWKRCPRCQAKIKQLGLKDELQLQSYFVQRMERWLNDRGQKIICWDEILEGGLAPNAAVMSWRGEEGGIEAARAGHPVVMTPGSHCYLDHAQSKTEDSLTIGGFIPPEKVYNYDPIPLQLESKYHKNILGAQGNLWTEYIDNFSKVEYQIFLRMQALSEVLWSAPGRKQGWESFKQRWMSHQRYLRSKGAQTSDAAFQLFDCITNNGDSIVWSVWGGYNKNFWLSNPRLKHKLQSVDTAHFKILESGNYQVLNHINLFSSLGPRTPKVLKRFDLRSISAGKIFEISVPPSLSYSGNGVGTISDGVLATDGLQSKEAFLGWQGASPQFRLDLGARRMIDTVRFSGFASEESWIYKPEELLVWTSVDGKEWNQSSGKTSFTTANGKYTWTFSKRLEKVRFIRIQPLMPKTIPAGKPGAGNAPWLFVDEVQIF